MNVISSNLNNRMARGLAAFVIALGVALSGGSASASPSASGQVCYFGECLAGTSGQAQSGKYRVDAELGHWTVLSNETSVLVELKYDDGAVFAFAKKGEGNHVLFFDRNWNLNKGEKFVAKVDIDGRLFTLNGEAFENDTLIIPNLSDEAMKAITTGQMVRFQVAGSNWSVAPAGAVAVLDVALRSR